MHRGADLRQALARDLYNRLANDSSLLAAFVVAQRGEQASYASAVRLDVRVARVLLAGAGDAEVVFAAADGVPGLRHRVKANLRPGEQPLPSLEGVPRCPVCFVVHNEKFLRFVAPVVERTQHGVVVTRGELDRSTVGQPVVRLPELLPVAPWKATFRDHERLLADFDQCLRLFRRVEPAAVVVIEGNAPTDETASRAARRLGIPAVCIQHGWSPIIHSGFRQLEFDRMLVWGEGFQRLLEPFSPRQQFVVTGNHAVGEADPTADERLAELVAGRPAVGFYLQSTSQLITREHLRRMEELILSLAAGRPDLALLVRQHPNHPLDSGAEREFRRASNVLRVPPHEFPLGRVIAATTATVSIYSTTLLESASLGVVPVVFNPTSLPHYVPDLETLGAGVEAKTVETVRGALERIVDNPEHRRRFLPGLDRVREEFFAGTPGDAVDRAVAAIGGTIGGSEGGRTGRDGD